MIAEFSKQRAAFAWHVPCDLGRGTKAFGAGSPVSINSILASAMTALQTNTAALKVVSDNVSNINTQGYSRRVVNQTTQVAGGGLTGVDIASVQRVVNQFLQSETLSAGAGAAQYGAQSDIYDQLNGILGQPGDGNSLTAKLDNIFSALSTASQAPSTSTSQQSVLTALQGLATTISSMSSSITTLQTQVDGQIGTGRNMAAEVVCLRIAPDGLVCQAQQLALLHFGPGNQR